MISVLSVLVLTAGLIAGVLLVQRSQELRRKAATRTGSLTFTDSGKNTMIARLLDNRDTGLTLVYQDQQMKVYKLSAA